MILTRKLRLSLLLVFIMFTTVVVWSAHAEAADYDDIADGNWNSDATWSGTGIPGINDNVTIDSNTVTLTGTESVNDITIAAGGTLTAGGNTLNVGGDWDLSGGTFNRDTSTVVFDGSSAQTITGVTVFFKITIASGASVRADSDISHRGLLTITGTLEIPSGVTLFGPGAAPPELDLETTGLLKGAGTYHCFYFDGRNPTIDGSIAIADYQYRAIWGTNTSIPIVSTRYGIDSPDNVTTFATNVTVFAWGDCTTHTLIPTAGTLQIDGDLTIAYSQACSSKSLTVDNSTNNATITVGGDLVIGDSGGTTPNTNTFITGDANVTVSGNVTIYASGSGENIIDASGMSGKTLYVGGDWINSDTFTAGTSTVAFNGTGAQGITSGGDPFSTIEITNSTSDVTFLDSLTATNFTSNTGSVDMKFNAGSTYIVTNLTLNGAEGSRISLRSTVPGTQWNLAVSGAQSLSYVDVADSNASGGDTVICINRCTEGGDNNDKWIIQLVSIPTMTEWGIIIFMILAGLVAVYCLRRRRE